MEPISWQQVVDLPSRSFTCGYCGQPLASMKGWYGQHPQISALKAFVYICHHCLCPSFFDPQGKQTPAVGFGNPVRDLPDPTVAAIYEEARSSTGAGNFTAAVLCCRKLLMHIAVSKGAKPGDSFVNYVQYLADKHYVPPDAKEWVDHIRTKGNEANHEIAIMRQEDAQELLSFSEMLLKVIFEFPATIKRKARPQGQAT